MGVMSEAAVLRRFGPALAVSLTLHAGIGVLFALQAEPVVPQAGGALHVVLAALPTDTADVGPVAPAAAEPEPVSTPEPELEPESEPEPEQKSKPEPAPAPAPAADTVTALLTHIPIPRPKPRPPERRSRPAATNSERNTRADTTVNANVNTTASRPALPATAPTPAPAPAPAPAATTGSSGAQALCEVKQRVYPPLARRRGLEGRVELNFTVNPDGSISNIVIHTSSGHALLDQAAIAADWHCRPPAAPRNVTAPVVFELSP